MFFKLFRAPRLDGLSFLDWANRVVITLRDSKAEVEESKMEDTFDNILEVFRVKSYQLLSSFQNIPLHVDKHGIYAINRQTEEKVYVLQFNTHGKVMGLPLNNDFSKVSAHNHISGLLIQSYKHRLGKFHNQQERLEEELKDVLNNINSLNSHLVRLSVKEQTRTEIKEYLEKGQLTESDGTIHKLGLVENRLKLVPVKKKKTTKKKKKITKVTATKVIEKK
jgi:hypothetical protein